MAQYTDSQIVEYNEDGSWTTTTVVTNHPATPQQKALAVTGLVALIVAPIAPLLGLLAVDQYEKYKDNRRSRKAKLEAVTD